MRLLHLGDAAQRVVVCLNDGKRLFKQHAPLGREAHLHARSRQQFRAALLLQREHVLAQGRLRDVERAGGLAEIQALRQLNELLQMRKLHSAVPSPGIEIA